MTFNVLVVEDDPSLLEALTDTLMLTGYTIHTARCGQQAIDIINKEEISLVVSDIQMDGMDGISLLKKIKTYRSEIPVILMTAYGTIQQAVDALHTGATDYLVKPFEPEVLVNRVAQFDTGKTEDDDGFIAVDKKSNEVMELARKVASKDITVMVSGESGAGKEVLVRYIHSQSSRADKPFVAINCAAIPDNMLEAMLFGYQKGAFTGAYKSSPGKFEQAQGGTLLLDEISEMSLGLQAKLLRVLQEREVERLGDQKVIDLDVRVMATSNRNMKNEVVAGRFREDLYYRLNVFPISMPALKERPDDIIPIAEFLLARACARSKSVCPLIEQQAKNKLVSHSWPGNVRELDNVMQRALILQSTNEISQENIQFEAVHSGPTATHQSEPVGMTDHTEHEDPGENNSLLNHDLKSREQKIILDALSETAGSRKSAAEKLGISPRTLRYKLARMREQGVDIPVQ